MTLQKWGGLASFLLPVALIVSFWIYLTGNLRSVTGPLAYDLADFLSGPLWASSLVTAVYALRERMGRGAPHRMTLSLLAAALAAGAMLCVACIRSANRHYHLAHPDLHVEESIPVLVVWTTLVAGILGAGWHALGWAFLLLGSAGCTTRSLPRILSVLYLVLGIISLVKYRLPDGEYVGTGLLALVSIWQGVLLWRAGPEEMQIVA